MGKPINHRKAKSLGQLPNAPRTLGNGPVQVVNNQLHPTDEQSERELTFVYKRDGFSIPIRAIYESLTPIEKEAFVAHLEAAKREWHKRSEDTPYTKSWLAKQLGISRPYLNKLLKDPEQFTIKMVKQLANLSPAKKEKEQ